LWILEGFIDCLIDSIEIAVSVESLKGFHGTYWSPFIFPEGIMIKEIQVGRILWAMKERSSTVFVVYDEGDLKKSRHRFKRA
jgi:hypothetical protein